MRILVLTYEFPPLGGGAGNAAAELVRDLAHRPGVEVSVVTSSMAGFEVSRGEFAPGATIYYLPIGKERGNIHYQTNGELLKFQLACHLFLRKLLARERFDVCHAQMTVPAGFNAWMFRHRMPYVVSLQGSDVPGYSDRFSLLYHVLTPPILRVWKDARAVVANSVGLRDLALAAAPAQPVGVIPNGIDRSLFCPGTDRRKRPRDTLGCWPPKRVVCVGRLIERKGVKELVEGFARVLARLPEAKLDLVGAGVLEGPLRAWIAERGLGDRITLHGAVDHALVPRHLRESAVFALPSHNEGMSNALLEGIACGLPVIVTQTGGTSELFDGNGVVVPKRDPDALAHAMIELLTDNRRRREMSEASLRIADRYSWSTMTDAYMQIYEGAPARSTALFPPVSQVRVCPEERLTA